MPFPPQFATTKISTDFISTQRTAFLIYSTFSFKSFHSFIPLRTVYVHSVGHLCICAWLSHQWNFTMNSVIFHHQLRLQTIYWFVRIRSADNMCMESVQHWCVRALKHLNDISINDLHCSNWFRCKMVCLLRFDFVSSLIQYGLIDRN